MTSPNTNALSYNGYIQQIATLAVVNTTTVSGVLQGVDAPFNAMVPMMLDYAELRIQRDLDLLPTLTSNTYPLNAGSNIFQISPNDFVTIQTISVIVGGVNYPLLPVTKEFLQNVYGDSSVTGQPIYFAMYGGDRATGGNTYNNILVGPYPDNTYSISMTGTARAPSLYFMATSSLAATGTTFISTNYPDLLIMASMVYLSGFQRNFGAQSGDPSMAVSYEGQYQMLLANAKAEEYRKKFMGPAGASESAPPQAVA